MISGLIRRFEDIFGRKPILHSSAPGRINIIGEHTDYNNGYVLPAAVHLRTHCLLSPRNDREVHAWTENFHQAGRFSLDSLVPSPERNWLKYVQGIFWVLREQEVPITGADILLWSDLPLEAGLSSSAALEICLLRGLLTLMEQDWAPEKIARMGQRAENEFVGVRCGLMDQFIAVFGREATALFLDCETLAYEYVPLRLEKEGLIFLVYDTKVPRQLADSAYNQRREEARAALEIMKKHGLLSAKQARVEQLEELEEMMPTVLFRRARHVISENNRVLQAREALEKDDFALLGELLFASHASLRDDYEVSCPELDLFVEIARNVPGCYGARLVGAGFGGSAISLVKKEAVEVLIAEASREAEKRGHPSPETIIVSSGGGASARRLSPEKRRESAES